MSKIKIFSLGGLNELGKNMFVIEVNNDIFVFDAGLKYADENTLGIDYIIPTYDYLKKRYDGMDEEEIIADMEKDLQNNLYGSRLGAGNKHKSCRKMPERKRTKRMRDAGIW